MSRILGIDHGERRVGLAISDPMGIIAKPFRILDREITPDYISEILNIAAAHNIHKIVVGLPLTLKGGNSSQTKVVQAFSEKLRQRGKISVIHIDERLSSVAAERSLKEQGIKTGHAKGRVDETAAAIILQEYLDSMF